MNKFFKQLYFRSDLVFSVVQVSRRCKSAWFVLYRQAKIVLFHFIWIFKIVSAVAFNALPTNGN